MNWGILVQDWQLVLIFLWLKDETMSHAQFLLSLVDLILITGNFLKISIQCPIIFSYNFSTLSNPLHLSRFIVRVEMILKKFWEWYFSSFPGLTSTFYIQTTWQNQLGWQLPSNSVLSPKMKHPEYDYILFLSIPCSYLWVTI